MSKVVHDAVKTSSSDAAVKNFKRDENYHYCLVSTADVRPGMPKPTARFEAKGYEVVQNAPENCEYRVLMRIPRKVKEERDTQTILKASKLLGDPTGGIPNAVDGAETIAESERGETKTFAETLLRMPDQSPRPRQGSK